MAERETINIRMRFREISETRVIKLSGFAPPDPNSPASKFMRAFDAECTVNPLNDRALVWQNQAVVVLKRDRSNPSAVELSDIRKIVSGGGAKALQRMCDLADQFGVTLTLYAKAYEDVPTEKLVEYYKRFGFTDFGVDLSYLKDVGKVSRDTWEQHDGVDMERKPKHGHSDLSIVDENAEQFAKDPDGSYTHGVWKIVPDIGARLYGDSSTKARPREWWIGRLDDDSEGDEWIRHTTRSLTQAKAWVLQQR